MAFPQRTLSIDAANQGRRVETFVRQWLPEVSRATLMKWIRQGKIRVNQQKTSVATRLSLGDVVTAPDIAQKGPPESLDTSPHAPHSPVRNRTTEPPPPRLDILWEDAALLVVNKPVGVVCQPGSNHEEDSLFQAAARYLKAENALPGHKPGIVQRLDRDVSGVVLLGKNAAVLRALSASVATGTTYKTYMALVLGKVASEEGTIDLPLYIKDQARHDEPRSVPVKDAEVMGQVSAKEARTHYQVIARYLEATLLSVQIDTGRLHQIRAHLLAIGHPIIGDPRYGPRHAGAVEAQHAAPLLKRPFLHALRLTLVHPQTNRLLEVTAPLQKPLSRLLERLLP